MPTKRARTDISGFEHEKIKGLHEYQLHDMADAEVFYMPDFLDSTTATEWYTGLLELDSWYRPKLKVYGKEVIQSRKIAAYATDSELTLKYSGHEVDMKYDYPPLLRRIQDEVEEKLGVKFNHVLLNLYEDGSVYIGKHRDGLHERVIASVSLGAPRTFIMTYDALKRSQDTRQYKKARHGEATRSQSESSNSMNTSKKQLTLNTGSLLVMQGDTQHFWKHEIPKESKVKEGRISLTFRQLVY